MRALEVMTVTKDPLGEVMVRFKMLPNDDGEKLSRVQVREIVYSIFQWTRGRYSFESRVPSAETIVIGAPADVMLLEAVKRIEDWARVYEGGGGVDTGVRTTADQPKVPRCPAPIPRETRNIHM